MLEVLKNSSSPSNSDTESIQRLMDLVAEERKTALDSLADARKAPPTKKHGPRGRSDGPKWIGLTSPSGRDRSIRKEAKDGRLTLEKGWKLRKYFPSQSDTRQWSNTDGGPTDSDPSSSFDSDDSPGSSSSSEDTDQHRYRQK